MFIIKLTFLYKIKLVLLLKNERIYFTIKRKIRDINKINRDIKNGYM